MATKSNSEINANPNKDLPIPEWINENYFEEILENEVRDYQRIVNFKTAAATAPGDNYASIMVRVFIDVKLKDGKNKSTTYILKTCLGAGDGASFVNSMNLFPREKQMYEIHLPKFEKLYKEAGVDIKLAPKCLRVDETPERISLVLEDLKHRNFKNVDRLKGMDMEHATIALQKIAEFHAASAVYRELNGPFDDMYMTSFFSEANRELFTAMGESRMKTFIKAMKTWGLDNAENFIDNTPPINVFFDECLRMNNVDPNEFNVLNHGDCWSNNIMFNYKENGEIDEMLFVDFQVGKWGTPAQDLWYFIMTSVALDIKIKKFDYFINIYHQRLVECLKLLRYSKKMPTLKEMHILMLKYGNWGFMTVNGTLTVVVFPSDKDANINTMLSSGKEGEEFEYKLLTNPLYIEQARELYPFFIDKGIMNFE